MSPHDPVDLLFDGMEKFGPGGGGHTRERLLRLTRRAFGTVVHAGRGTGRQTLVLAAALSTRLRARASAAGPHGGGVLAPAARSRSGGSKSGLAPARPALPSGDGTRQDACRRQEHKHGEV
jgi:hypothetical protein